MAKQTRGQGWRILGEGSHRFSIAAISRHVVLSRWLRRRSAFIQRVLTLWRKRLGAAILVGTAW
jgi:hypothetical protein